MLPLNFSSSYPIPLFFQSLAIANKQLGIQNARVFNSVLRQFVEQRRRHDRDLILHAYQPVLPQKLIEINIKIKFIANNYNYLSHALFHQLSILTHDLKYIFIII